MRLLLLLSSFAILHSSFAQDSTAWLEKNATLIFHEAFEREEDGNLAKAIGNGWNSATADRVPDVKMADLDGGILKVASAWRRQSMRRTSIMRRDSRMAAR